MALSDDLRKQLRALSDDEKKSAGEEILNGLPLAAHDDLLKARLAALFTEKSQIDKTNQECSGERRFGHGREPAYGIQRVQR